MSQKAQLPDFDFEYCTNKRKVFENYCKYMFTRTQSMFVYDGLPDTIPVQWLESYLQRNGSCIIAEHNGKLYALLGNAGGEYNEYYQPTKYVVANPWLKLSKEFKIGEDCVYCRNDYDATGLTPLISRYCGLMTENLITVRLADVNMRMMNLLSAADDDTVLSTKQYLNDLEVGKLGVIAEDGFFDGIKLQGSSTGRNDYMVQFIELQQYLKGSLYNELGINANFNMKREAINGEEAALNDDALMPLIDDMLKQRRIMCDELNEMFGLNISVDYGSSWHANVAEKAAIGDNELNANPEEAAAMGGDEVTLPDDQDPQGLESGTGEVGENVSQLNENEGGDTDEEEERERNSERPDEVGETDGNTEDTKNPEDTANNEPEMELSDVESEEREDLDSDAEDSGNDDSGDVESADEESADEEPADEESADEESADEEPADEESADKEPADEEPADNVSRLNEDADKEEGDDKDENT